MAPRSRTRGTRSTRRAGGTVIPCPPTRRSAVGREGRCCVIVVVQGDGTDHVIETATGKSPGAEAPAEQAMGRSKAGHRAVGCYCVDPRGGASLHRRRPSRDRTASQAGPMQLGIAARGWGNARSPGPPAALGKSACSIRRRSRRDEGSSPQGCEMLTRSFDRPDQVRRRHRGQGCRGQPAIGGLYETVAARSRPGPA